MIGVHLHQGTIMNRLYMIFRIIQMTKILDVTAFDIIYNCSFLENSVHCTMHLLHQQNP
jgi:hypothetical protein